MYPYNNVYIIDLKIKYEMWSKETLDTLFFKNIILQKTGGDFMCEKIWTSSTSSNHACKGRRTSRPASTLLFNCLLLIWHWNLTLCAGIQPHIMSRSYPMSKNGMCKCNLIWCIIAVGWFLTIVSYGSPGGVECNLSILLECNLSASWVQPKCILSASWVHSCFLNKKPSNK